MNAQDGPVTQPHMTMEFAIRRAISADYEDLADIMFDAVRNGSSKYTEEQRAQWVPVRRTGQDWIERLEQQAVFVAHNGKRPVGFMSLAANGYIDFAYIRPEAQGTGLFRQLFRQIEELVYFQGASRLWVHASLMAKSAFAAMGFDVVERQFVSIGGLDFERFEMEKWLR